MDQAGSGPSGITQEQFQELLVSLCSEKNDTAAVINQKMAQLKHELAEEQDAANNQLPSTENSLGEVPSV